MSNFWEKLNKPIFCLAPMLDVTDVAFREMFAKYSKTPLPEGDHLTQKGTIMQNGFVMYTEFVNTDGLTHEEGYKRLSQDLKFTEIQRPIVAQIWGNNPAKFEEAARIVANLGFDGIDINMGCPQDKEIAQGTCAALIRNPKLAIEIIEATKKGGGGLPVSVKTRLGYSKVEEMDEWLGHLLTAEPAVIALHARTKQEKSKTLAHWDAIKRAVEIRNKIGSKTLIIGNGDIKSKEEGLARVKETGCDGVMIGRGAFGNPWIFRADNYQPNIKERLSVMLEHARLFNKEFSGIKSFVIMRKHFKAYVSGFDGASELRSVLMSANNQQEVENVVNEFLSKNL